MTSGMEGCNRIKGLPPPVLEKAVLIVTSYLCPYRAYYSMSCLYNFQQCSSALHVLQTVSLYGLPLNPSERTIFYAKVMFGEIKTHDKKWAKIPVNVYKRH